MSFIDIPILLICLFVLLFRSVEHGARRRGTPLPAARMLLSTLACGLASGSRTPFVTGSKLFMVPAVVLFSTVAVVAGEHSVGFREDFTNLDAWKSLTFPKIDRHSRYSITSEDENSQLKAEADNSASGLISKESFDPYRTPILRWRWRVENIIEEGNAKRKDGDDYPLRVYVLFDYDPDRASLGMRAKYAVARRIHGEYPPHAALNYIWANRRHSQRILPSPYTKRSQLVVLQAGRKNIGEWQEERVNILRDYRAAFGEDPPRKGHLAIMSDADNTGESAVGFLDTIKLDPDNVQKNNP